MFLLTSLRPAAPRSASRRTATHRNVSNHCPPLRVATLRPASHRNAPQRFESLSDAAPRCASPRPASRRNATQRFKSLSNAARRFAALRLAPLRIASLRNATFQIIVRRSAPPRSAAPRSAARRSAPQRNVLTQEDPMKIATVSMHSLSPYSPSKRVGERKPKEDWRSYEERICKDRVHINAGGHVFIPPMAFKRSLETAAKFLRKRIPGKDRSEYGKHFIAGVLVPNGLVLKETIEEVNFEWLFLSSRGKRGQTDVEKCEPFIAEWAGDVQYYILDDTITPEVFEEHLREAGNFIGIGRFRPENGGFYGRYQVQEVKWQGK
jgi:hypothetical protein